MDIMRMDDNVFEALFRQAIIDEYNKEIESIPQKSKLISLVSLSPEFDKRMKKLFLQDRRKDILTKIEYYGKRVAVVFLLVITIISFILLTNPEVRAAIKNVLIEWYDKYTSIIFRGQETNDTGDIKEFVPEYLPEGFKKSWVSIEGNITDIEYVNELGPYQSG
jgi:hypothetical protein